MAVNCSTTILSIYWMTVEFPTKASLILSLIGQISQTENLVLFEILIAYED